MKLDRDHQQKALEVIMANEGLSSNGAKKLLKERIRSVQCLVTLDRYMEWFEHNGHFPNKALEAEFEDDLDLVMLLDHCLGAPWLDDTMGLSLLRAVWLADKGRYNKFLKSNAGSIAAKGRYALHEALFLPNDRALSAFARVRNKIKRKLSGELKS